MSSPEPIDPNVQVARTFAPVYPVEAIPGPAGEMITSLADSMNLPAEMFGPVFLASVAGTIGTGLCVYVSPQWSAEYPVMWTAVVAPSGAGKTVASGLALGPLRQFEARLREEGHADRIETNDATIEGICQYLADNPRGVLMHHDELSSLPERMNAYRKGDDLNWYLGAWSARPYTIMRKGKRALGKGAEVLTLEHTFAAVTGGIQPGRLSQFRRGGGEHTGFMQRFLFAVPPASSITLSAGVDGYADHVSAIATVLEEIRFANPATVHLSESAAASFADWHEENRDAIDGCESDLERSFLDKMPSHVLRFALVLHALEFGGGAGIEPLSTDSLVGGIALVTYHKECLPEVLKLSTVVRSLPAPELTDAVVAGRILDFLQARGGEALRSDLHDVFNRQIKADRLDSAVTELKTRGEIDEGRTEGSRGRPAIIYRLVKSA